MLKDTATEDRALAEVIPDAGKNSPPVDLAKIDTLHELLALALDDFEKVLGDRRYAVDMGAWHERAAGDRCAVCLAGSVIAQSLGVGTNTKLGEVWPIDGPLDALNLIRTGEIVGAARALRREVTDSHYELQERWEDTLSPIAWARNRRHGRRLRSKLRIMQKELAEAGL